jgi:VWFA-related protein
MSKWATLLLLWGIAWPALADKSLSIEQMEETLFKLQGKPDGKVAGELEGMQVTERVSPARLARWESDFPGKRTQEQLMKLADMSAFLNPPASDVLRDPPPDMETQQHMVALAVEYVRISTVRLPNFYATRETTHFEDTLSHRVEYSYSGSTAMDAHGTQTSLPTQTPGSGTTTEYRGLHSTGEFEMTVTYRDGHEVLNEDAGKRNQEEEMVRGLTSSGEFGPILGKVISDVSHTGVSWLRWEEGNGEPAAVFHYEVPANQSHFKIGINVEGRQQAVFPAYKGEIKIDPATGQILRLSEEADPDPANAGLRAAIVIDYAPVKIGDQSYICPVRGVAFSMIPVPGGADEAARPVQVNLNDVAFTHYHEFGSEARIVANASPSGENSAASASGAPGAENSQGAATAGTPAEATSGPAAPATAASTNAPAEAASSATPPAAEDAAATPAANPAPSPEATSAPAANSAGNAADTPAGSVPATAASNAPPAGTLFHAQSRLVVLDVSVSDHDKPVEGLECGRFHVFEDGHEVPIESFEENEPPPSVKVAEAPVLPPDTYSNVPVYPEASAVNVLLLDALNTPTGDQEQARKQMIAYISTIKPGTALAIFTLSSRLRMVTGFTTDVAKLKQALDSRKPNERSMADVGANSSESMASSLDQAASSIATSNDPGTRWMVGQIQQFAADNQAYEADQRVTMTLNAFSDLARFLAAIPGKKNLIWFAGSFPISLSPDAMLSTQMKDVKDYSIDVRRASALLSSARISVYPVDARGLMVSQTASADYTPALTMIQGTAGTVNRDNNQFSEQNSQDQSTLSSIAAETGGRAFANGNGLKETVAKIVADGSSYYSVSYVPPDEAGGKHSDEFRKIEVRIDGGKYQLSYRRGYFSDQEDQNASQGGPVPAEVTSAALLGAPPATQILFQARVLPEGDPGIGGPLPDKNLKDNPTSAFKGAQHPYVVDLGVQPGDLNFAEGPGGAQTAHLAIALVAYDKDGQPVNSLGRQFALSLPPAQLERLSAAGRGIPVRVMLNLPAGAIVVRAVVYDPSTAKVGSIEVPVDVPSEAAASSK